MKTKFFSACIVLILAVITLVAFKSPVEPKKYLYIMTNGSTYLNWCNENGEFQEISIKGMGPEEYSRLIAEKLNDFAKNGYRVTEMTPNSFLLERE